MLKYSWGLVSFCLNEQWLCVLAQAFFPSACNTSSPDGSCQNVFHHAQRGSRQGRCSMRMQQVFSALCMEGRAQRDVLHGQTWDAHRCWGGTCWVCADWPVITQEGQHWPLLPLGTDWSTILLSCFFAFFLLKGFIFFHVSAFHLSPWPRNDYHLNNYTSVCFYSSYLAGL